MDLGMKASIWLALWAAVVLTFGCRNDDSGGVTVPAQSAPAPQVARVEANEIPRAQQGRPQPRLPTVKLWVGTNVLTAEVAATRDQIMAGMMWRTNMAEMEGMLFVMPQPHRAQFWMRNTLLPLSCAYIDPEGTILELHDMKPLDETGIQAGSDNVLYVLEVNQGWFQRHGVTPGMLISTDRGPLTQVFFRR
jgi:uncharacterized membrane protein (UPF0127 family)